MPRRHSRSRRSKETPGWMWMLLGLTIGLVVAGYVYVSDVRPPRTAAAPQAATSAPAAKTGTSAAETPEPRPQAAAAPGAPAAGAAGTRESAAETPAAETSTAQTSTAQAPADRKAAPKTTAAQPPPAQESGTRFLFYDNLPQSEVVVAEPPAAAPAPRAASATAAREPAAAATAATAASDESGRYMLQVGSFRTHADADRRKASIALLGYESHIQQATVNGDVVHRVLVGPITGLEALDDARRRFRDQNFDTLVLKAAQ